MDNQILLILIVFILGSNNKSSTNQLHTLGEFIKGIKVDPLYTVEKLNIMKKIAPLVPEEYSVSFTKSLDLTNRIVKIIEATEIMKQTQVLTLEKPIEVENDKDRINKILTIVQKEIPKSNIKNPGMALEFIINIEKYQKMFSLLNTVIGSQAGSKENNNLMNIMSPLIANKGSNNEGNINDMGKVMEIIKLLDSQKSKT